MTPFQEQSLVRQLKALRATPLPAGFEQRLLERLEQERQPEAGRELPGGKRARGKLILLAAIVVPFAAAAAEMAWRAIESTRAQAQFADAETTPIVDSYTPLRNPMLTAPFATNAVATVEPESATRRLRSVIDDKRAHSRTSAPKELTAGSGAPKNSDTSGSVVSQGSARIEKLTPNWSRVSGGGAESSSASISPTLRLPAQGSPGTAADNRGVERRSDTRAGERHGAGSGEQRDQHRERLRLGQ